MICIYVYTNIREYVCTSYMHIRIYKNTYIYVYRKIHIYTFIVYTLLHAYYTYA